MIVSAFKGRKGKDKEIFPKAKNTLEMEEIGKEAKKKFPFLRSWYQYLGDLARPEKGDGFRVFLRRLETKQRDF